MDDREAHRARDAPSPLRYVLEVRFQAYPFSTFLGLWAVGVWTVAGTAACKDDVAATAATTTGSAGSGAGEGGSGAFGGEDSWIISTGSGGCDTVLYNPPNQKGKHVDECDKLDPVSNPPTTGPHYPRWANFAYYDKPFPAGYYLHNMEHGAVLLLHKCVPPAAGGTGGGGGGSGGAGGSGGSGGAGGAPMDECTALAAELRAFADTLPEDDKCTDPLKRRILVLPEPNLDVPFAVASWGYMLKAQCFDESLVSDFIEEHYAQSPEDVCGGGFDPTDPTEEVPPDCGE